MKFFDFTNPIFRPLWVRILVVAVCFGWGFYEASQGFLFWAGLFIVLGGVAAWNFATIDYTDTPDG